MDTVLYFLLLNYICTMDAETTMRTLKVNTTLKGATATEFAWDFTVSKKDSTQIQETKAVLNTSISTPSYPTLDAYVVGNLSELHVGMKAIVRLTLSLPAGYYQEIALILAQHRNYKNVDMQRKECITGKALQYEKTYLDNSKDHKKTGFVRISLAIVRYGQVYVLPYDNITDRQFSCDFYFYFHNPDSLADGQIVRTNYAAGAPSLPIPIRRKIHGRFFFTARTSLLPMNKTGFYELDPDTPSKLNAEIKSVKKIVFRAWIPYYNPTIKVHLEGKNTEALYVKVQEVGGHFYPGAEIGSLKTCNVGDANDSLQFPAHWVNRGYYDTENTTDDDVIVFEAGIALSETAIVGTDNNITINLFIDDIQVWTSTVTLVALASNSNEVKSRLSIKKGSSSTLSPLSHVTYILKIIIPAGRAKTLNLTFLTKEITTERDMPLSIENIALSSGKGLLCWSFKNYSQSEYSDLSSLKGAEFISVRYLNGDSTSALTIQFDVKIDLKRVSFNGTYILSIKTGKETTEKSIIVNKPTFFQDKNMMILSTFHQVLDDDITTCITLPVNGKDPPILLMRIQTSWFGIEVKAFNVIIKGKGISCEAHGKRNLLVSYPKNVLMGSFQGSFATCDLINENEAVNADLVECAYRCYCNGILECSELILFMSNREKSGKWDICELNANNI